MRKSTVGPSTPNDNFWLPSMPASSRPPEKSTKSSLKKNSTARTSTLSRSDSPPPPKKLRPLTFAKPPIFSLQSTTTTTQAHSPSQRTGSQPISQIASSSVRKAKARAKEENFFVNDDRLWVDKYEPQTENELAVHSKKVTDVRRWFQEAFEGGLSGHLKKYRQILVLTGPAGTAKTTTVRVLARELGFEIIEWKNSVAERQDAYDDDGYSLIEKFQAFLLRASTCRSIFGTASNNSTNSHSRQIILVEDLPNILHPETQTQFHEALQMVIQRSTSTHTYAAPIVIVISDAGLRGESGDDFATVRRDWKTKETFDIRSVIPPDLLHSPYITKIKFNPIAPTVMKKGLHALLDAHFSGSTTGRPTKDIVEMVVESSNGDIRSAVMALQFACVVDISIDKKGKKKTGLTTRGARVVLESVTRREQSLALFHLIGKVLYNKRKGDPPGTSATKKDVERDRLLDQNLRDPTKLPEHLKEHERKVSRVDVDTLYADTPIDSSLFSLYIHQNYTQFCDEVEHCGGISDWLSWVDYSGPEEWFQANPHRFHLLTLGTLHSLPTPVVRRSQKFYKPDFFGQLKTERQGLDGVWDVQKWLAKECVSVVGRWTRENIALELGAVLKAREQQTANYPPPVSHTAFSTLVFKQSGIQTTLLNEDDNEDGASVADEEQEDIYARRVGSSDAEHGGWLEGDDIEDF